MQFVIWEFRVKSNKMQWLSKNIHFTVRKDTVSAKPSPCTAQTWQSQQHCLHQTPCCLVQAEGRDDPCPGSAAGCARDLASAQAHTGCEMDLGCRTSSPIAPHCNPLLSASAEPAHLLVYCIIIISMAYKMVFLQFLSSLQFCPS